MARVLVWDLPTRLFHWLLAAGVVVAFAIAQFGGKRGPLFPYHAMIGIMLAAMVLLRVVWGLIGTRYARFASFVHGPGSVMEYLKKVAAGEPTRHVGHNPASSWAIYLMLILVLAVAGSGLMMQRFHELEEVHSVFVYVLLGVAGVHVAGVLLHTIRNKENITLGMITGRKDTEPTAAISSSAPLATIVFTAILVLLGAVLTKNYDSTQKATKLFGTSIQLGAEAKSERGPAIRHRDDDDD